MISCAFIFDFLEMKLFFTGWKFPSKRYQAYFPTMNFIFDPVTMPYAKDEDIVILTHSVGLIKALIFCKEQKINPRVIIAMDTPDISLLAILDRMQINEAILNNYYVKFMDLQIDPQLFNIISFRQKSKKLEFQDCVFYKLNQYYAQPTHNPFEIKLLRDRMTTFMMSDAEKSVGKFHSVTLVGQSPGFIHFRNEPGSKFGDDNDVYKMPISYFV
jgi:hypothetical protein